MRRATLLAVATLSLTTGACTTVDMTSMGSGAAPAAVSASEPNVIEKATSKLFALFSSKGWSTHDSRKKMQSAASVLLNGLEDKSLSDMPSPYAESVTDSATLSADIREASSHVDQTVKAAEIFLAMSGPDQDIRVELSDLEQALLASRQAENVFAQASDRLGAEADLQALGTTVDRLRDVTDEFGRRVRRANSRSVASRAGFAL